MSIDQQNPPPAGPIPPFMPPPAPAPAQGTNGLSIAGFILAFFIAPVGFVLSIIGLVMAGRRGQKGKGLAIAGIIVSVLLMGTGVAITVAVVNTVGDKVETLVDPGCTEGKTALLNSDSNIDTSDPDALKKELQTTIDQLNAAAAKAKHDNVRNAVTAISADYTTLLNDINSGTVPTKDQLSKIDTDANAFDSLCSISTPATK